jgi:ubiquinone/menaquinone biosynthesis C-methylase UbiE
LNVGLLESPDRDYWQKPSQIMDALSIAEGSAVADLGAGGGWFTIRLARRVGPNGTVYAQDIQPLMIQAIKRRVQKEGLSNVITILGTPGQQGLPPASVDSVLIVDVVHEVTDRVSLLRQVARALRPQGRVGIVDFKKGGGGPGPPLDQRIDTDVLIRDARSAGLKLQKRETFLPFEFLLVFGK